MPLLIIIFFVTSWSAFFFLFLTLSRDSLKFSSFLCSKYLHTHSLVFWMIFHPKKIYYSFLCTFGITQEFQSKDDFLWIHIFSKFLISKSNILFVIFEGILNSVFYMLKWNPNIILFSFIISLVSINLHFLTPFPSSNFILRLVIIRGRFTSLPPPSKFSL